MNLLVIDGNSILNRAFYGIRILTTKDGRFTNAVYGFLSILLKLKETTQPDCVAAAFDVSAPTFRHEMYTEYKAGRHRMPEELAEQLPVIKELLPLLGVTVLEAPGWEADDILGTLAACCRGCGNTSYIATGDRDSLHLAHEGVKVVLSTTKMGSAVTTIYDEGVIQEEYGVTPEELIQVKALMGDSSDNIPGVAGVGQKTALSLIRQFHTLDNLYENIDSPDIKKGVREKLIRDREQAYLSLELGTIRTDAPVDCGMERYAAEPRPQEAAAMLADLEMFKMIERFGLSAQEIPVPQERREEKRSITCTQAEDLPGLLKQLKEKKKAYLYPDAQDGGITDLYFQMGDDVRLVRREQEGFDAFLKALCAEESIALYVHDTKLRHRSAFDLGVRAENVRMDTMLAAYLLSPSSTAYDLPRLAQDYKISMPACTDAMGNEDNTVSAAACMEPLCAVLEEQIRKNGQEKLLYEIELPLAGVLGRMEKVGVQVDIPGVQAFSAELQNRIQTLIQGIYDQVGYEFNINSPKQLGVALFEKLMLPASKKTKTGYSTSAEVLEGLRDVHPVIDLILEYRTLAKLKSTYCDALVKLVADDGRIHTSFNQAETRTGRISSTEPNMQNIPVRTEIGREMRRFFSAKAGCVLVDADYSQIELRVLAALAEDETMLRAFNDGEDIHTITASQVFDLPVSLVTPLYRSRAKAVNFGIVYGIGAFSLAKDIGVTRKEADLYIKGYLNHYRGVDRYMKEIIDRAKQTGYAETVFGRRRYLPELTAPNANLRAFGERVARNMPIQGTAADIIKIAMIRVDNRLRAEGLEANLILQVHDELIVEAPEEEAQAVLTILEEEMEAASDLNVRLLAEGKIGKTWYDAKA
ncbi:MAG: DNA polymerase I [Clostridiales bacterium]|nr:DNA polymerase I [Clostridiales bacterium]